MTESPKALKMTMSFEAYQIGPKMTKNTSTQRVYQKIYGAPAASGK